LGSPLLPDNGICASIGRGVHPEWLPPAEELPEHHRNVQIGTVNALSSCDVLRRLISIWSGAGWKEIKARGLGERVDLDWFDRTGGEVREDYQQTMVDSQEALGGRLGYRGPRVKPFPVMSELCNKVALSRLLVRMQRLFPTEFRCFCPETICLTEEEVTRYLSSGSQKRELISMLGEGMLAKSLALGGDQVCIVKPADGTQGAGIFLVRKWQDLESILPLMRSGGVIQHYVPNPLLDEFGYKFDLRVYVLVTSVDPLRVFVCREGLARFCTEKYERVIKTGSDLKNMLGHLTNYSLNKKSDKFEMAESPYNGDHGTKRTISAYFGKLSRSGVDVDALWESMDKVILKTMFAMQPLLADAYRDNFGPNNRGRNCFQVLGFDFLLDTDLQPWLLEINNNPDWSISHQQVYAHGGISRRVNSELDTMVKQTVVSGAIRIVLDDRLKEDEHERQGTAEEQRRGSMSDWGLGAKEDWHGGKYNYIRLYPLDRTPEQAAAEAEEVSEEPEEPQGPIFAVGERISARFDGTKHFYPGKILSVHPKGDEDGPYYDVFYDDGDSDTFVPESHIHGKNGKGKQPTGLHALRHKREGDHSELTILDDVRRLHQAVFGELRQRGRASDAEAFRLRLRHFVQKCGLADAADGSKMDSTLIDLCLAKMEKEGGSEGALTGGNMLDPMTFCDFLILSTIFTIFYV